MSDKHSYSHLSSPAKPPQLSTLASFFQDAFQPGPVKLMDGSIESASPAR